MAGKGQYIGQQNLMSTIEAIPRTDLLPPDSPAALDEGKRITFSRLITMIGEEVGLTEADTTVEDLQRASVDSINQGLAVERKSREYKDAKQVYAEVVFPAGQYVIISRSPMDLAEIVRSRTVRANDNLPPELKENDRNVVEAKANRSAGHALEKKADELEALRNGISEEHLSLRALLRELRSGGRAHYSGRNLDNLRKRGHTSVHTAVEVAAVNLDWDNETVDGVQRAVHYNLYGHHGHNNQRRRHWLDYTVMAGRYARARIVAVEQSMRANETVLSQYRPFLETARQPEADD